MIKIINLLQTTIPKALINLAKTLAVIVAVLLSVAFAEELAADRNISSTDFYTVMEVLLGSILTFIIVFGCITVFATLFISLLNRKWHIFFPNLIWTMIVVLFILSITKTADPMVLALAVANSLIIVLCLIIVSLLASRVLINDLWSDMIDEKTRKQMKKPFRQKETLNWMEKVIQKVYLLFETKPRIIYSTESDREDKKSTLELNQAIQFNRIVMAKYQFDVSATGVTIKNSNNGESLYWPIEWWGEETINGKR